MSVDKTWHRDAEPHRRLRRGMRGDDIRAFQRGLQKRADRVPAHLRRALRRRLKVDGVFGDHTLSLWREVRYAIGLPIGHPPTTAAQKAVIDPDSRSKPAKRRASKRRALPLGERAWLIAGTLLHVREEGGNNRGAMVERIITESGGRVGDAWCGWFCSFVYRAAGSKLTNWMWGAVRLMASVAGLFITSDPKKGALVRFTFDHVALFGYWCDAAGREVPKAQATHIKTREGNTTNWSEASDAGGSEGVHERIRHRSLVRDFITVPR